MNPWQNEIKSINDIHDLSELCRHPTIRKTMFVGNCEYIDNEYKYIVSNRDFTNKWNKLLTVHGFGNPERYTFNINTSGNQIHMIHHLARFEEYINFDLSQIKTAYELGGGFGNMAEIVSKMSKVIYTIHDFKECLRIQENYLINTTPKGNFIYTDIPIIKDYDLFISTWALSECDIEFREKIIPIIQNSKFILIAYAATFNGVDNIGWFNELKKKITSHTWHNFLIPTMDSNHYYLFGRNFYI
jgi:hypothetical protein